jgi:hypothetical protein
MFVKTLEQIGAVTGMGRGLLRPSDCTPGCCHGDSALPEPWIIEIDRGPNHLGQSAGKSLVGLARWLAQHLRTTPLDHPGDHPSGLGTVEGPDSPGSLFAVQELPAVPGVAFDQRAALRCRRRR